MSDCLAGSTGGCTGQNIHEQWKGVAALQEKSRTEYSAVNTAVALTSRIVAILMGFITRVVFTHTLSESYVGVHGLFTDILNVLALSELGVETAISFALYRPIAEGDIPRQKALMKMFRGFYRITAVCVGALGLALIPFMDVLMKNRPQVEHLMLIYLLYLANSVISYLLVYKRTLIEVHQMNYIVLLYQMVFLLLQDICQIVILVTTGNFIAFLVIYIICTVLSNIFISWKADRMYPYLRDKEQSKLPEEEKKDIYRNIRAMLMHKLGNVAVNNTDNLIISSFVGVISVGIYSNYFLLIGSVRQVLDQIFQGITASVGNLGATEEPKKVKMVFETAFFIGQWLYGVAAICLYELLNPFVELSFGAKYLFPGQVVLILCINFFVNGTRKAVLTFRDSLGLFRFDRYKALVEAVLNLVISILLVQRYGTFGVFAGTFLSTVLTSVWVEPYMLYRHRLKERPAPFYLKYACYVVVIGVVWFVTDMLCGQVEGTLPGTLVFRFFVCALLPNLMLVLVYFRRPEFLAVKERAARMIGEYRRKSHGTS